MKEYNSIAITVGLIGGYVTGYLGGYDVLLKTLALLVFADYVSAVIKAIFEKKLNPDMGYVGILKKVLIFMVVVVAVSLEGLLNNAIPLREIVIVFYVSNEGMSFFKNVSAYIPFPESMTNVFEQLRSKDKAKKGEE